MWKKSKDQETEDRSSDDQLLLPLDERFRQAEQYSLDFEPEVEEQKMRQLRRILNS